MGTPPRKYNKNRNNKGGGGGNNRSGKKPPPPPPAGDPAYETACFYAGMSSVSAYVLALAALLIKNFSVELLEKWPDDLFFFADILAGGGALFAIILARAIEQPSSSQLWKINLAIYPGISFLLFSLFIRYAPQAQTWGIPALGIAFLLSIITMLIMWRFFK